MLRFMCLLLLSFLPFSIIAEESDSLLKVEVILCKSVEDREPVEQDTIFPSDVGKVYCWTLVTGATEPTAITHVWYYGEKEMASVELQIKSKWFRTWSYKTILSEWTGDWNVKVEDTQGNLLTELDFKVVAKETE